MSDEVMMTKKRGTLFVGAYERENFGDLLFLHVTKGLLGSEALITAGTPFRAHASSEDEHEMVRYADALEQADFERVWAVGGEIGGTTLLRAYLMSATDGEYERFIRANKGEQREMVEHASGMPWYNSAYMPRLPRHRGAYVVNSTGMWSIGRLRGRELRAAITTLHRADYVSVREGHSHRLMTALGVRHTLAPDVVHAIRHTNLVAKVVRKPVALIQIRQETLNELGVDEVARTLAAADAFDGLELRLFRAGSARNHDSLAQYERVIERLGGIAPGREVSISRAATSIEKASEIAQASLWVGTSLHGNVISTAFGVPRVGLENTKVDRYCRTWSEPMPYGVRLRDLNEAAAHAMNLEGSAEARTYSKRMEQGALDNFGRASEARSRRRA